MARDTGSRHLVKAWRGGREGDDPAERPAAADADALEDLRRRGIDLDPTRGRTPTPSPGHVHVPGEPAGHAHPHVRSDEGEPPIIGIVGAGAVGTALGAALHRAGWPVAAVASRDPARRERFRSLVPGARAFAEAVALLDDVELVILAVPDDAIAPLARTLHLYSGQAIVHTSGALGPEVLEAARAAGTQAGTFHPLVAFADTERAIAALHGATVAIEGDEQLASLLADMAEAVGAIPVRLAPGGKAAYHAAAVLAAGGFVALLDAIAALAAAAGLDEPAALDVYAGLIEQSLGNARALGIRDALTGPMVRGDEGTIERHLDALARLAPDVLPLYRVLGEREVGLAEARGAITHETAESLRGLLAMRV